MVVFFKKVRRCDLRVVIVGAGEVGYNIAEQLILEKKDVVLIDKDPERTKIASSHLDCLVLTGDGTNIDNLKEAGIEQTDIFISVTDSDEVNMISCFVVANEFNVPVKLARVRNLEYGKTRMFTNTRIGIDFVVNPEYEAAKSIVKTVEYGATTDVFSFEDLNVQFRDVYIDEECNLDGKSIKEIRKLVKGDFLIAGILRDDDIIIPHGETVLKSNDHIFAVGTKKSIYQFLQKSGIKSKKIKRVLIVGGGNIGSKVAESLSFRGRLVTVVDSNYEVCKNLAERFPDVTVLHGDISDNSIYEDEQLDENDLIITTTDNEELNILTAVYGKTLGIKRSIALVNKSNYLKISRSLGIDATISPKISSASAVLRFIRRGNIKAVHTIFDGMAEAIEFKVTKSSPIANKLVKDLHLPEKSLIVAVNRNNEDYIPGGDFEIKTGDNVIVFAKKESIKSLEESIII